MINVIRRTLTLSCVTAFLAACGGGGSGGDTTTPPPPPPPAPVVTSVAVTCTPEELQTSDNSQCAANVQGTGAFDSAVEWSVEGGGEVDAAGSFTAPTRAATVTITATSVSHPNVSGAATITVSRPRALTDLPDDDPGYQVHILYVVASDGEDRELDTSGAVELSVEAWNEWMASQTAGRRLRLDRVDGALDVTFVRLDRTDAEINTYAPFVRDHLEAELILKGFSEPNKIYQIYYDGGNAQTGTCGSAPLPPVLPGTVSAIYLNAVPSTGAPCNTNSLAMSVDSPGYLEFASLHETIHALGFVPDCAPNLTDYHFAGPNRAAPGHVSDSNTDLMYAGPLGWNASVLDFNADDYFEADLADCLDLADSAFLDPLPASADPPPGWPYETLLGMSCAREGAMRSTSPGVEHTTGLHFFNGTGAPINVYWLDYSGTRQFRDTVQPYGYSRQGTYATHPWVVTDETNRCLGMYKVGDTLGRAIIEPSIVASLDVSGAMPLTSIGESIQLALAASLVDGSNQAIASASVHWASSDPAVATVVDGTVTAVGGGHAEIVATYEGREAITEIAVHISVQETGTVRMIYAAPTDREFRSDYRDAIRHAVVDLQSWYRGQTGGLTFSIYDTTPEQCRLSETADYYDQNPWNKVFEGLQHCAPVQRNTTTFAWVVYADLDEVCDQRGPLGRGGPGLTILHSGGLEGLIGNRLMYYSPCGRGPWPGPVTRFIGGLGHELGHALGLSHPPGCSDGLPTCDRDAIMHLGYTIYPNTHLRSTDKHALWRSPYIDVRPAQREIVEQAGNAASIRGMVTDPNGAGVEGIRIAAVADAFWAWAETASGGSFEIHLPEGSSGSSALSVHAGSTSDCGWLGYHGGDRLSTIRQHATRIEMGASDPPDIEITLPDIPGELCQGQRTVSGIVLGPEVDPVGVSVRAFGQWSTSGEDGLFEIRLPESTVGRSPLYVNVSECRHVGFYGPGGFTTRLADAWQVEYGGVDVAGIEIRLPATPQELCDRQPKIAGTVLGADGDAVEGIVVEAQPFVRRGTSGTDGNFEIRLLEGTAGTSVLAVHADCGLVGYYGPDGFTTSRADATGVEVMEGNLTGIEIRFPAEVDELCGG